MSDDKRLRISLFEMTMCLSNAMDMVSPYVVDHHKRVAYIASSIAAEMGLPEKERENLILAGLLHDIGAFSLKDRLDALNFDSDYSHKHAELGHRLIKTYKSFAKIAPLIRFHHVPWDNGRGNSFAGEPVPLSSHILHLADRIAVRINLKENILEQTKDITKKIKGGSGEKFVPELIDTFVDLSKKQYFWFDIASPLISQILVKKMSLTAIELGINGLLSLTKLFGEIIDFRSPFTATHSSGVAASAVSMAKLTGMTEEECIMMKIAGYLHDLGKLAVPSEILGKPGKLMKKENNIIKNHPYHTYRILDNIRGLETIKLWASFHHECLDGRGYPFHLRDENIPHGSKIMAVADVFTALTEDRPYRQGMSKKRVIRTLRGMAKNLSLDKDIVEILIRNYDDLNDSRLTAQAEESREYTEVRKELIEKSAPLV